MVCVFCGENHLSSRCRNVTDINVRYKIVKNENRCFVCLKKNHRSRECRLNYNCIKCQRKHNIALCDGNPNNNNNNNNGDMTGRVTINSIAHTEIPVISGERSLQPVPTTTNISMDDSMNEVLLQCALADISDTNGRNRCDACVLFDGCSQRSYVTVSLQKRLNLTCIRKEKLIIKTFASSEGRLQTLDVVQLCVKGKNGITVYVEALCVPHICSKLEVPSATRIKRHYTYLSDVELAKPPTSSHGVEILIGLDYYFSLVSGKIIRGPPGFPVAVESIIGWIHSR